MKNIFIILILAVLISCRGEKSNDLTPRYVITSPEVGEIVYLLQGTKNVVGITEEVNYPQAYRDIPKVGRFGAVSRERIISLQPTLVFTSGLEQELLSHELNKAGIKTVMVYPHSIAELFESIEFIAAHLNAEDRGKAVADSLREQISHLRYRGETRPRVYLEIYGDPIMSVSQESFVGELVETAGGENIFRKLPREYSRVRAEDVIGKDPEIIILTYPGVTSQNIQSRMGWQQISACRDNRIYDINDINPDLILRAGPRIIEGIGILKEIIHSS